ncbi:D-Ala-D-Ala carboxypeptidase VanY [Effusibacillus pohliae]|uniref:D-Ala-D-Ala carboxypeptidase VanY n=1 Tax=Effusibacillus pohliae TaxID=232270 RepID=UPI00037B4A17|nr:D-Ala-D-Ala carboxypeptidase VanY [Effusibacillus pohliae]
MRKIRLISFTRLLLVGVITLATGCNGLKTGQKAIFPGVFTPSAPSPDADTASHANPWSPANPEAAGSSDTIVPKNDEVQVAAKPDDIAVLVNKKNMLPANYKPSDLVEPAVPFIFREKDERRLMRKEAAQALERLIAGAGKDGIYLAVVSAYRSYDTQKTLFAYYIKTQGEEAARKYSAEPGHSEHQTGLAVDVSGSTGKCAAEDCFADTPEAKWLAQHAAEYGFIIRYPKGKESVTGYNYEPWHIRYVGTKMAKEIAEKGFTLEEYLRNAVPASE